MGNNGNEDVLSKRNGHGAARSQKLKTKCQNPDCGHVCEDIRYVRNIVYNKRVVQWKQVEYRGKWGTGECV